MDPNETLRKIRVALSRYFARMEYEGSQEGDDLAIQFEKLDNHLSRGGILPDAWASRTSGRL